MPQATNYYMLLGSLPHMPRTFEVDQPPISRIRLQQRLAMLGPQDAEVVDQVQRFLQWDRQPAERTDSEVQNEYNQLIRTIRTPLARAIIAYRMDVRTITSALRRRRLGVPPPTAVGKSVDHIRIHWERPHFGLIREHPWIPAVERGLQENNPLEVERQLLLATWNRWTRLADKFHFSFESVLLYLALWEIIDRWTRSNEQLGRKRFDTLLTETLGTHVQFQR